MTARNGFVRAFAAFGFLLMVVVNALANILPINGITTGEVSDAYPNLFAPAAITFAIWGVIYLLLLMYTVYQLGGGSGGPGRAMNNDLLNRIGPIYGVSSLANTVWIFCWHYRLIPASMALMLTILICLILIMRTITREVLTGREKVLVKLPFGVYFGWITVATIANLTTLLVSVGWDGFGLSEVAWTVAMIVAGLLIGTAAVLAFRCVGYGLVIIWAYTGIAIKHASAVGFANQYPAVRYTALASVAVMAAVVLYVALQSGKEEMVVVRR